MSTLGGGEKQTLVLAEHLSKVHEVFLFSRDAVDIECCQRYFNVDLSNVSIVTLSDPSDTFSRLPLVKRLYYFRMNIVHLMKHKI